MVCSLLSLKAIMLSEGIEIRRVLAPHFPKVEKT